MVSGVLAARTGRVAHAIYLDAFVPMQGQAMANFVPPPVKADFERLAAQSAIAAAIQKDSRFRYAEVDGHHNVMLIDPPRFVSALLALTRSNDHKDIGPHT